MSPALEIVGTALGDGDRTYNGRVHPVALSSW
jgi:hypothetical protein